jgi:anti-sigma factor RsiW
MSDLDIAGTIGPEHDAFAELLAAYLDEELAQDERVRVDGHLQDCGACRRELAAQAAVRARLNREAESLVTSELTERVMSRLSHLAAPTPAASTRGKRRSASYLLWSGWLIAAGLAAVWIYTGVKRSPSPGMSMGGMSMATTGAVSIDSQPGPISGSVLAQFRDMNQSDLPSTSDVARLKQSLPFGVPALHSPHMRLISAWTTELDGEPAAAIAYRCHDRLVIQYVVSEKQFFRHPQVRRAIAQQGLYAASNGSATTVAWPDLDSGSFLVGQFTAAELAAMRL